MRTREPADRQSSSRDSGTPNRARPDLEHALRTTGQPLPASLRTRMEASFDHDFSRVRVHHDPEAAASAERLRAHAWTYGQHVMFGAGRYRPETASGFRLLAHELAHVTQQTPVSLIPDGGWEITRPGDTFETQADSLAGAALSGSSPPVLPPPLPPRISRQDINVDIEEATPAEREALHSQGVDLPQVSAAASNPRIHSDYIENRLVAVGYGLYLGGFLAYCRDLPLPIFVPSTHVNFNLTSVATPNQAIYPNRDAAVAALPMGPPIQGQPLPVTFYRGAGGGLIAPVFFSPATTPRFVAAAQQAMHDYVASVQQELAVLAATLVAGITLRLLIGRLARIGSGSEAPRAAVPPGTGAAFGREMATEMSAAGFKGNPFREFLRRLNARPQRLPPEEAAEAIAIGTREASGGTMGTMPPVQVGNVLVVPSRAEIPNAPVMGIRPNGQVIIGRVPRLEIVRDATGTPVLPLQVRLTGDIVWE